MLPKSRRLTSFEVQEVLRHGRPRRATYLTMKYQVLAGPLKTSAVVAKAVAKKATDRNRLRRAVYRALTPISGTGHAVVFVIKIPKTKLTDVFSEDIQQLFKKH